MDIQKRLMRPLLPGMKAAQRFTFHSRVSKEGKMSMFEVPGVVACT